MGISPVHSRQSDIENCIYIKTRHLNNLEICLDEIIENKSKQQLIAEDRYYGVLADELIFLTPAEHNSLHHKGKPLSKEHCQKISAAHKGKHRSDKTRQKISETMKGKNKGKHLSDMFRQKISAAHKGKHYYNNGIKCILAKECLGPEWKPGRL